MLSIILCGVEKLRILRCKSSCTITASCVARGSLASAADSVTTPRVDLSYVVESRRDVRLRAYTAERRRQRGPATGGDGGRAYPGSSRRQSEPGESLRGRSHRNGGRTTTLRSLQLLGLSRRPRGWRDGSEPARRRLDLWEPRCAALQLDCRRTRARHALVATADDRRSNVEARHIYQGASHTERAAAAAR